MKVAISIVLLSVFALAGNDSIPNSANYTLNVHVGASRRVFQFNGGGVRTSELEMLDVLIGGKKYELLGMRGYEIPLIALGDYKAKLVQDVHKTAYESLQAYEFVFSDGKTRKYQVIGQTE